MAKEIILIVVSICFLITIPSVLADHPTYIGSAGYLTDTSNNSIGSADVRVNISTSNSCSSNVFWSKLFSNAVDEGVFGLTIGSAQELNLSYNQDYYICYTFDDGVSTETFGAYVFRGGQGEIDGEDINETGDYTFGTVNITKGLTIDTEETHLTLKNGSNDVKLYVDEHEDLRIIPYGDDVYIKGQLNFPKQVVHSWGVNFEDFDGETCLLSKDDTKNTFLIESSEAVGIMTSGSTADWVKFTQGGGYLQMQAIGNIDMEISATGGDISLDDDNLLHEGNITNPANDTWGYFNNGSCIVIGDLKYVSEC